MVKEGCSRYNGASAQPYLQKRVNERVYRIDPFPPHARLRNEGDPILLGVA